MAIAMRALKAHVKGGRLLLDEPTELPEGADIELVSLDEVLASGGDYLDDEERERDATERVENLTGDIADEPR